MRGKVCKHGGPCENADQKPIIAREQIRSIEISHSHKALFTRVHLCHITCISCNWERQSQTISGCVFSTAKQGCQRWRTLCGMLHALLPVDCLDIDHADTPHTHRQAKQSGRLVITQTHTGTPCSADERPHHGCHRGLASSALRLGTWQHIPEAQRLVTCISTATFKCHTRDKVHSVLLVGQSRVSAGSDLLP